MANHSSRVSSPRSPIRQCRERTQILSPANEQYENRSKLLRYHYKRAARRSDKAAKRYKQCSNVLAFMSKRYKRYKRYTF